MKFTRFIVLNAILLSITGCALDRVASAPTTVPIELQRTPVATSVGTPISQGARGGGSTDALVTNTNTSPLPFRSGRVVRDANGVIVYLPFEQRVILQVGQKFYVVPPFIEPGWKLQYDAERLELTATVSGWTGSARVSGETEIVFLASTPGCANPENCPGMPGFTATLLLQIDP